MNIEVLNVDFKDLKHVADLSFLLDVYAKDPMGGGEPLQDHVRENIGDELAKIPHAFSVMCYVDSSPAGLVNCFEAFSTFNCRPLVNIHDVVVHSNFRGLGISQLMLDRVEQIAKDKGCCKITLEVLEGNKAAQNSYQKFGFAGYELDPEMGRALFWQKNV